MAKRDDRKDLICDIVRQGTVRTQQELTGLLAAAGCECTQATVSRDIAEMGLAKTPEGFYIMPQDLRMQRMVSEMVTQVNLACNMVIVNTIPGGASSVAGAIDAADIPGAVGSVAGDDTIMIAASSLTSAQTIQKTLLDLRSS